MINRNGNIYTIIYALLLAALVAGILAWVSTSLAPRQKAGALNAKYNAIRTAALLPDSEVECSEYNGLAFYRCIDGPDTVYVLPCSGTGLWGPVWGYIALDCDLTGVRGAAFDHKSETPGLGAQIAEGKFGARFAGRPFDREKLFNAKIDGLVGATRTSQAVEGMVRECVDRYAPFLDSIRTGGSVSQSDTLKSKQ